MVETKKPFWKKFKFWLPVVTGIVTSASYAVKYMLDFDIPEAVINWIIVAGLNIVAVIVGVEWNQLDDMK